ncbi:hypothetical protein F4861DRAFT_544358 [Xylaria intraflava]|nr:hypothetical protein F4861DRAFT_544358 [Xylaria intraflava]
MAPRGPAYDGPLTARSRPLPSAHRLGCTSCYSKVANSFDPTKGMALRVRCRFGNPNSSACVACGDQNDRCEPVPGLIRFDQLRVEALLEWGVHFFSVDSDENDEIIPDEEGLPIHFAPEAVRCRVAGAQLRLLNAFNHMVTYHRTQHHLTSKVSLRFEAVTAYEKKIQDRRAVRQAAYRPLKLSAPAEEKAAYRRKTMLRLEPHDQGFDAWSAAVQEYVDSLREFADQIEDPENY